jgi:hypothetical protein
MFRVYDLYLWLAGRFPHVFVDQGLAAYLRAQCADMVDLGLRRMGRGQVERKQRQSQGRWWDAEGWENGEGEGVEQDEGVWSDEEEGCSTGEEGVVMANVL